jgi:hypothetical protein
MQHDYTNPTDQLLICLIIYTIPPLFFSFLNWALTGDMGVVKDNMELEYRSWSGKRKLTYDLMSLIATLGLCLVVFASTQAMPIDNLALLSVTLMGACSARAIYAIFFKVKVYHEYRNYIMASM